MTPVVAVEVAPAKPADDRKLLALLRACSQALPEGTCESVATSTRAEPAAVAHVTWDETGNALVTVRLRDGEHDLTRELGFAPVDPELQRWRSAGLAIATIVDELQTRREAELEGPSKPPEGPTDTRDTQGKPPAATNGPPAIKPAAPPSPTPSDTAAARSRSAHAYAPRFPSSNQLELGALGGTGLSSGAPRGGVYARAAHDVARLPAFAHLRVAYLLLSSADPPSVAWTELGLGGGAYWTTPTLRLEAAAELEVVRTSASAKSPADAAIDTAAGWLPGASLSLGAIWPARGPVAALLGGRGSWLAREVVVTNAGEEIGRVPAYSVGFTAGVRFVL